MDLGREENKNPNTADQEKDVNKIDQSIGSEAPKEEMTPEEMQENYSSFVRWMSLAAAFVVFVILGSLAVLYIGKLQNATKKEESKAETESVLSSTLLTVSGVIYETDQTVVKLYDASTKTSYTFDLAGVKRVTDAYGMSILIEDILVGSVAEVRYYQETGKVELFRFSPQSEVLHNSSGIVFSKEGQTVTIGGKSYLFDDKTIVTYHGTAFSFNEITANMVMEIYVLDNHIYTIRVICGEGTIRLASIPSDYQGQTLVLAPESGPTQRLDINNEMKSYIAITEGLCNYYVETEDGTVLTKGSLYVPGSNKNVVLTLLPMEIGRGIIHFSSNVSTAKIKINDVEYECNADIALPYGEYEALVGAQGYTETQVHIVVEQPYKEYVVNMNALRSYLVLSSRFKNVVVTIGEEEPIELEGREVRVLLKAGTYLVTAEVEGYEPLSVTVEIRANEADKVLYFSDFKQIITESEPESEPEESTAESEPENEETSSQN